MEYKRLGKAGVQVSRLSFGSWVTFGNQVDAATAKACMHHAYDHGINFFDNAEVYAKGESERVMGKIIHEAQWSRDTFLVSSKVFWGGDKPNQTGLSRKHIMEAADAALKRLRVDYLDFFYCHRPDRNTPIEETVWAMHHLIQQGKVLYWGTSEWSAQEIQEAIMIARQHHLIAPTMEQPQYNMLVRHRFEVEYDKLLREHGYGTTIWSPLASGILTGKYNDGIPAGSRLDRNELKWIRESLMTEPQFNRVKRLAPIASDLGLSTAQLALAWCMKNPFVSTVILGATSVEQLQHNLAAQDAVDRLNDAVMEAIETALDNKPKAH